MTPVTVTCYIPKVITVYFFPWRDLRMDMQVKQKVKFFFATYPVRKFKKGEILIFASENPNNVYYLLDGNVRQYDVDFRGEEVVVNVFKPPAFFPMNYVINRQPNEYIYDAASNVSTHAAPVDDVLSFVRDNPDVLFDLLARVYSGIDGILRRQFYLMSSNANDRLIYELIIMSRRIGKALSDKSYLVNLTEAELASRVGLTRETVSRRLQAMKKRKLIQIENDGLVIVDIHALEGILKSSQPQAHESE